MTAARYLPLVLACLLAGPAFAQLRETISELEGLDIVEKRGDTVPKDLTFTDGRGNAVKLGQFVDGTRPVLLSLNYSACPMLCGLQMNGLADVLSELGYDPGDEYRFVSVSIDPLESQQTAALTRTNFLKRIDRKPPLLGVEFLVGKQKQIETLADSVGFQYRYLPEKKQYVHFPVLIVLTPDGVISRYLYGVAFNESDVRLSLYEAGEGTISSVYEKLLLSCFKYDPNKGKYTPFAWGLMRFSGVVMLCVLAAILLPAWFGASRVQQPGGEATDEDAASTDSSGDGDPGGG